MTQPPFLWVCTQRKWNQNLIGCLRSFVHWGIIHNNSQDAETWNLGMVIGGCLDCTQLVWSETKRSPSHSVSLILYESFPGCTLRPLGTCSQPELSPKAGAEMSGVLILETAMDCNGPSLWPSPFPSALRACQRWPSTWDRRSQHSPWPPCYLLQSLFTPTIWLSFWKHETW